MLGETSKQIITGNIFLVICCIFYLIWWIIAFKPEGAIKGMKSGWLLLPAIVFGLTSIAILIRSFRIPDGVTSLFQNLMVVIIGAVVYVAFLVITGFFLHRVVTTELLLIVGWVVLAVCEINILYAYEIIGRAAAWSLITVTLMAGAVSMICYMRYYALDARKGWICGMIPLILVMAVMLILTAIAAFNNKSGTNNTDVLEGLQEMRITSANLHGGVWDTDITNTRNGRNIPPELTWESVEGAAEYAVYMIDPSAGNWLHWRAYGIKENHLDEGAALPANEYIGPYPPSGTHTYIVYIFALKSSADTYPGTFDSRNSGIEDIIAGIDKSGGESGNIIGRGSLSGTYTAGE